MQYLTLEEAAKRLQMSPDELREMAKKKTIRAFQDRGSWRFRSQDIDELARERGMSSDPEMPLADSGKSSKKHPAPVDDDDEVPLGREKPDPRSGPRSSASKSSSRLNPPVAGSDSDVRLVLDDGLDFDDEPASPKPTSKKKKQSSGGPDSDVRLERSSKDSGVERKKNKGPSDSDIRLQDAGGSSRRDPGLITEEIDLDAEEAKAEIPPKKKTSPKATQMANLPTTSPFEISEPDMGLEDEEKKPKKGKAEKNPKKSGTDSSSDFELIPFDESKSSTKLKEIALLEDESDDEVALGGEIAGGRAGQSGVNLRNPADSGISLEDDVPVEDDSLEFELSLDSGVTPKPAGKKASQKGAVEEDGSSEFELSLDAEDSSMDDGSSEFELSLDDDSSVEESMGDSEFELTLDNEEAEAEAEDQDIFEETSFDVPPLDDSGSEAVALDDDDADMDGSDFELSMDDESDSGSSESQVVALDDDEDSDDAAATVAKPRKKGKVAAAVEEMEMDADPIDEDSAEQEVLDEDEESAPKKKRSRAVEEDEDEEEEQGAMQPYQEPEWGPLPVVLLLPTVAVMFLVGLMGFELLRGMWGYQRPSAVGTPIIDTIARTFDDSLPNRTK
jgi:excisionase family DNA binding protein